MTALVYDLTEVFRASTGKFKMYGIVRTVLEIATHLVKSDADMRYAVFSYAHEGFVEVFPKILPDGSIDLGVPQGISEFRIRTSSPRHGALVRSLIVVFRPVQKYLNRRNWRRAKHNLAPLDMTDKLLVSASRPKIISDAVQTLRHKGQELRLAPLLYDMIPLHKEFGHKSAYFPGKFLDDNRTVIAQAEHVLTISNFTKDEVQRFAQEGLLPEPEAITTVPLVHECPAGEGSVTITLPDQPYLLTVGATMGRKNLDVSFDALLQLQAAGKDVPYLVLAGAPRRTTKKYLESQQIAPIRDRILIYPNPEQADLLALYQNALAVVMASRMEGWGLPAGEALWCGTPALCSTAPVLREVCGDLALYFDPDDPQALARHVTRLMTDHEFRETLRERISAAKPKLRRWHNVAEDLKRALQVG